MCRLNNSWWGWNKAMAPFVSAPDTRNLSGLFFCSNPFEWITIKVGTYIHLTTEIYNLYTHKSVRIYDKSKTVEYGNILYVPGLWLRCMISKLARKIREDKSIYIHTHKRIYFVICLLVIHWIFYRIWWIFYICNVVEKKERADKLNIVVGHWASLPCLMVYIFVLHSLNYVPPWYY